MFEFMCGCMCVHVSVCVYGGVYMCEHVHVASVGMYAYMGDYICSHVYMCMFKGVHY